MIANPKGSKGSLRDEQMAQHSFAYRRPFNGYYQFRISLAGSQPEVWRRIQVPDVYSFWDLHVALTDCMPWLDYHLHVFRLKKPGGRKTFHIGIPDDDGELDHLPGWRHAIADFFTIRNTTCSYEYDFGDSWEHIIELEAICPKEKGTSYPRCIAGENACPPEDVGGIGGYQRFLTTITGHDQQEKEEMLSWARSLTGQYPFDPTRFSPHDVHFDDPQKRWAVAFTGETPTPDMRCFALSR